MLKMFSTGKFQNKRGTDFLESKVKNRKKGGKIKEIIFTADSRSFIRYQVHRKALTIVLIRFAYSFPLCILCSSSQRSITQFTTAILLQIFTQVKSKS